MTQKKRIIEPQIKPPVQRQVWNNPGLSKHKRLFIPNAQKFSVRDHHDNEEDDDDEPELPPSPIPDPEIASQADGEEPLEELEVSKPPDVQIMGLGTKNPVVSYDGEIYECTWSKNIGTELLFTAHPATGSKIPYLRRLEGGLNGVDCIGATCVRIQATKQKKIQQRKSLEPEIEQPVHFTSRKAPGKPWINIGPGSSQKRVDQKEFLEKMMAVKDDKGEDDFITVFAKSRPRPFTWVRFKNEKRKDERAMLHGIIEEATRNEDEEGLDEDDIEEIEAARLRLMEMDQEDKKMLELEEERRLFGRRQPGRNNRNWPRKIVNEEHQDEGPMLIGTEDYVVPIPRPGRKRKRRDDEDEDGETQQGDGDRDWDGEADEDGDTQLGEEDYYDDEEDFDDSTSLPQGIDGQGVVEYEDGFEGYDDEEQGEYEDGVDGS